MLSKPRSAVLSAWSTYGRWIETYPIRTSFFTGAVLWGAGNGIVQQVVEPRTRAAAADNSTSNTHNSNFNRGRFSGSVLFGGAVSGVVCYYYYMWLDRTAHSLPKLCGTPGSARFVASKVAFDVCVFLPAELVLFFYAIGVSEGKSLRRCTLELKHGFFDALQAEAAIWIPVQTLNFKFVPVPLQVLVVNIACLFEAVLLSWVQGHESDEEDERERKSAALVKALAPL